MPSDSGGIGSLMIEVPQLFRMDYAGDVLSASPAPLLYASST